MTDVAWTPEAEDELRRISRNHTSSELGRIFGKTRNAIIGKVKRMGLELAGSGGRHVYAREARVTEPLRIQNIAEMLKQGISADAIREHYSGVDPNVLNNAITQARRKVGIPPRAKAKDGPANAVARIPQRKTADAPQGPIPVKAMGWPKPAGPSAVLFLDRRPLQCAMPLWCDEVPILERMVCGEPVRDEAVSYCAGCCKLVFSETPRITVRSLGRIQ
jgi:hypothetical protein